MMTVKQRTGRKWSFGLLAFFALLIGAYALLLYGPADHIREQGFVTDKGVMPDLWYGMLWVHAVSAGIALAIGWLQFIKRLRQRMLPLHRAVGYVYAALIAIAGITGLYLACYADGGWSGHTGFALLSILWIYTLYRGLKSIIVERDPFRHGRWMIRNYALTCAAISLRLYTALAGAFFGLSDTTETFVVIAWLAWVPNLLLAEWLIRRRNGTDYAKKAV